MENPTLRAGAFAVSCFCHVSALAAFLARYAGLQTDALFRTQFYVFIGASSILMLCSFVVRSYAFYAILMLLRFIALVFMVSPQGFDPSSGYAVLIGFLFEIGLFEPYPGSLVVGLVLLILFDLVLLPIGSLALVPTYPHLPVVATFSVACIIVLQAAVLVTRYRERLVTLTEELSRMGQAVEQLADANTGFQQYAAKAEEDSSRRERRRITRELHDIIGYALTNVGMMLRAARHLMPDEPDRAVEMLEKAEQQTADCFQKSRTALHNLRAQMELPDTGLRAVGKLTRVFREATGVTVNTHFGNAAFSYGERVDTLVYRTVQEGMVNAFRHGKATSIDVFMRQDGDELCLTIFDNGTGCPSIKKGIGLSGMEERSRQLDGTLIARNCLRGFELSLKVPLRHKEA